LLATDVGLGRQLALLGFGGWAVTRKSDRKLIGMVGLFNAWRALEPEFGEQPEMGWIFAAETHGQGIASEACLSALQWAETNLEPTPVWAIIAPSNAPSFRLAERLGFVQVGEVLYDEEPTAVLQRPSWG
jgi:RimJ/RimL family protein N-acetyltransferase